MEGVAAEAAAVDACQGNSGSVKRSRRCEWSCFFEAGSETRFVDEQKTNLRNLLHQQKHQRRGSIAVQNIKISATQASIRLKTAVVAQMTHFLQKRAARTTICYSKVGFEFAFDTKRLPD